MPGDDYDGLAARVCGEGLDPQTPCLIVSRATTAEQRVHFARLANLAASPRFDAPVVLIVGAVAARYVSKGLGNLGSSEALRFSMELEPAALSTQTSAD